MSDVFAIFGTLLALGIAFPGMLAAWWLLFPGTVERSRLRLEGTPWRCFWLGGVVLAAGSIPTSILLALPFGPAKLLGSLAISALLAVASLGAAGLAALMGARLAGHTGGLSPAAAFLRGAIALELAAAFPIIGWLIVIPLTIVTALGAASFALLRSVPRISLPAPAEPAPPAEELA